MIEKLQLLNVADTAALLSVSKSTICKLAKTGKLPYVRFGADDDLDGHTRKCLRFRPVDIEKFLRTHYSG